LGRQKEHNELPFDVAMSDVQIYLLEFDKNKKEATRIAEESAKSENIGSPRAINIFANHDVELESKELKLLDLIQSLGEYLNHEEAPLRGKSKYLSNPNS
jgi:DNA repair/transcription protein MET18/MMS19